MGYSSAHTQGAKIGEENHTLIISELPAHNHQVRASSRAGNSATPDTLTSANAYQANLSQLNTMAPAEVGNIGGSQPHTNLQPYLAITWVIALVGIFPSRN